MHPILSNRNGLVCHLYRTVPLLILRGNSIKNLHNADHHNDRTHKQDDHGCYENRCHKQIKTVKVANSYAQKLIDGIIAGCIVVHKKIFKLYKTLSRH